MRIKNRANKKPRVPAVRLTLWFSIFLNRKFYWSCDVTDKTEKIKSHEGWNIIELYWPEIKGPIMIAFKNDTIRIRSWGEGVSPITSIEHTFSREEKKENVIKKIIAKIDK